MDLPRCTQVDENMRRAQQRDAVNQAKFFFRREIFTPASSRATSGATTPDDDDAFSRPSSTGADTPAPSNGTTNGSQKVHNGRPKHRVMANCFPPPPAPPQEEEGGASVSEECVEYTMDEIINGRVSELSLSAAIADFDVIVFFCFLDRTTRSPDLLASSRLTSTHST
jgi:glutamate--cysteine ligase catalytic subunit